MTVIASICARGGSTGVPRKNVRDLCGKPLIAHTIETALSCEFIDRVFVSTDDTEIAETAKKYGAEVPFTRPAELATSSAGKVPVIEHLVEYVCSNICDVHKIVDLDPTSPLRLVSDVKGAFDLLDEETDAVITGYEAEKNPYFNMVEEQPDGFFGLVKKPKGNVLGRQAAPEVFSMNASIYIWHRDTISKGLWSGKTQFFEMPRERSVDIDAELDFKIVEMLMQQRNENG